LTVHAYDLAPGVHWDVRHPGTKGGLAYTGCAKKGNKQSDGKIVKGNAWKSRIMKKKRVWGGSSWVG